MYYDPNDERSFIYFVKFPLLNQKFAVGCQNLRSASLVDLIHLAKDVAERTSYVYTEDPIVFCLDISKIITDDTSLAYCISKGYIFQILNGINEANTMKNESRMIYNTTLTLSRTKNQGS